VKIGSVIRGLATIPRALEQSDSDPLSRPFIADRVSRHHAERVTGSPVIDSSEWEIADERRWQEELALHSARVREHGIEALAWYRSFHIDQQHWGIYIPKSSPAVMEELYFKKLPISRERKLKLAWDILETHEQMHFAIDCGCAWFELLLGVPARSEFYARFSQSVSVSQLRRAENYLEVEEKVANIRVLRVLGHLHGKAVTKAIKEFMRVQPAGYRDAVAGVDDEVFRTAILESLSSYLATWILDSNVSFHSDAIDLDGIVPHVSEDILTQCPTYEVDDLAATGLSATSIRFVTAIPGVIETGQFLRLLENQTIKIRQDWERVKVSIRTALPRPPRFEKLRDRKPPVYSLRLRSGYRVHLRPPTGADARWIAESIGTHAEMGHG
jgi:hypothetical protein